MPKRRSAKVVNLDAAALLIDVAPAAPAARVEAPAHKAASPKRRSPDKTILPTAAKKRSSSRRDEMLSEYLSSLGRIPLLTADDEKVLASRLLDAEVACWRRLLAVNEVRAALAVHPVLEAAEDLRTTLSAGADLVRAANVLRDVDDDRRVVDEMIESLACIEIVPRPGEDHAHRRSRTLHDLREHRAILDEVRGLRRHALAVRNQFVRANLRLVVSVARRFHHYRLPLIDLIQEGNLGLIKSVHRFDHTKGFRFSTYAHWWIRQAIERAIMNKGAQVRLPVHIFDARREVAKATRDLHSQLKRPPTTPEIATALGMPLEKLEEVLRAVPREPHSLDEPVGDDEERTLGEMICDADALAPDEAVIQVDEERWVRRVLHKLSPVEVDILRRRYGLDTDDDETLEEIGKSYNLSRERVRQLQMQGLKKIQKIVEVRASVG